MFQPQTTATFSDNSQQNEKLVTSCEAFPPSRKFKLSKFSMQSLYVCNNSVRNNSHNTI